MAPPNQSYIRYRSCCRGKIMSQELKIKYLCSHTVKWYVAVAGTRTPVESIFAQQTKEHVNSGRVYRIRWFPTSSSPKWRHSNREDCMYSLRCSHCHQEPKLVHDAQSTSHGRQVLQANGTWNLLLTLHNQSLGGWGLICQCCVEWQTNLQQWWELHWRIGMTSSDLFVVNVLTVSVSKGIGTRNNHEGEVFHKVDMSFLNKTEHISIMKW